MQTNFQVRLAEPEDANHVINMLKKIAQWMQNNEIHQWQYLLMGGDDDEIKASISKKETFIILNDKGIVGTFTLSPHQSEWDQQIFGIDTEPDSLYLHRLAIAPEFMGNGLGSDIVKWIHANVKSNKLYLKLDCVADNIKLNHFYKENGFEYIGETDNHSKYQKLL
jgi:GNAT superfamily N-acetyltransferase